MSAFVCVCDAGVPPQARYGSDCAGRFFAESRPEGLPLSGPAEGVAGTHSAGTPGSRALAASR